MALISSRLDCCNSLLNNIKEKRDLAKLQRVQNCLACVVLRAPAFFPSSPLFKQLHWLPVTYRINFKLSTHTYCALSTQQPPYLTNLLHLLNISRQNRTSISQQLIVPKTKLNLDKRAFSVVAPRVWNEPITLKISETIAIFRKKLDIFIPNCISNSNKYKIVWHVWYSPRLGFNHHNHYLNSYTGFLLLIKLILSSTLLGQSPASFKYP